MSSAALSVKGWLLFCLLILPVSSSHAGRDRVIVLPKIPVSGEIERYKTIVQCADLRTKSPLKEGLSLWVDRGSKGSQLFHAELADYVAGLLRLRGYTIDTREDADAILRLRFGTRVFSRQVGSQAQDVELEAYRFRVRYPPKLDESGKQKIFLHYVYLELINNTGDTPPGLLWEGMSLLGDYQTRDPGWADERIVYLIDVMFGLALESFGQTERRQELFDRDYEKRVRVFSCRVPAS